MKNSLKLLTVFFVFLFLVVPVAAKTIEVTKVDLFEETSSNIEFSNGWIDMENEASSGKSFKTTNFVDSSVTFTFTGEDVSLIYNKGPDAAVADVEIDGITYAQIDASSPTELYGVNRVIAEGLENIEHTLVLTVVQSGSETGFSVDAFEVTRIEQASSFTQYVPLLFILLLFGAGFFLYKNRDKIRPKQKIPKPRKKEVAKSEEVEKAVQEITGSAEAEPVVVQEIKKEKVVETIVQAESVSINKRMQDILKTLPEREQNIVNYLIEENGKSTQARIHHATHIPRSSLTKRIRILQDKNIIEVKEFGKTNIVKLTKWFTSSEDME